MRVHKIFEEILTSHGIKPSEDLSKELEEAIRIALTEGKKIEIMGAFSVTPKKAVGTIKKYNPHTGEMETSKKRDALIFKKSGVFEMKEEDINDSK
jgi:nucleoid DNA-binding protein